MVFKMFSLFFSGCDDLRCRLLLQHFKFCPADCFAPASVAMRRVAEVATRMAEAGLSSFGGSKPASEADQPSYATNAHTVSTLFNQLILFSLGQLEYFHSGHFICLL